jgi:hypothetical protein
MTQTGNGETRGISINLILRYQVAIMLQHDFKGREDK